MSWIESIAPTIASALGGPLAGMAVEAVSKAIGVDPSEVQNTINSGKMSADQIAALQQAEIALKARAQEMGLDFEKLAVADRSSARQMQMTTGSFIPPILSIMIVVAWAAVQFFLLTHIIDPSMRELIARVLGTLDGALMLVLSFYFGSSSGSQAKDTMIHNSTPTK
jgi:lambda repressor-like predicted transcriptional regulator